MSFFVASTSNGTPARCGRSINACSSSVATAHADELCVLDPAANVDAVADAGSSFFGGAVVDAAGAGEDADFVLVGAGVPVDVPLDSVLALGSGTDESTTNTIAETPLQYLSHMLRNLGCPPMSHTLMVVLPERTLRMLNPTVGTISSANWPEESRLTSDVLPAACRPTTHISRCLEKRSDRRYRKRDEKSEPIPDDMVDAWSSVSLLLL